jgi:hypothetical protein
MPADEKLGGIAWLRVGPLTNILHFIDWRQKSQEQGRSQICRSTNLTVGHDGA